MTLKSVEKILLEEIIFNYLKCYVLINLETFYSYILKSKFNLKSIKCLCKSKVMILKTLLKKKTIKETTNKSSELSKII